MASGKWVATEIGTGLLLLWCVAVIGTAHGDTMIAGFVGLQRAEARLIKKSKSLYVIIHYYGVRKEKHSMITMIGVWEHTGYVHINDDFYNFCMGKYTVGINKARLIKS